jgi:hypothetical protein
MEEFSAARFYKIGIFLANARAVMEKYEKTERKLNQDVLDSGNLSQYMRTIEESCAAVRLNVSLQCIADIRERTRTGDCTVGELADKFGELERTIRREITDKLFMYVPSERAKFYDQKELFGKEVNDKFPSVQYDMVEAGNCYAAGRGTATVFHLMRVMETGLKALAKGLKIPYAPSWESYLRQIESQMGVKHSQKSRGWKNVEPFYRDAAGDLQLVKLAWRNPTMHIVKTYTLEEAEDVLRAVKAFMVRLASRCNEQGPT